MPLADFVTQIGMKLLVNTLHLYLCFNTIICSDKECHMSPLPFICEAAVHSCLPLVEIFLFPKNEAALSFQNRKYLDLFHGYWGVENIHV